jgi:TPR repeat protein
VKSFKTTDLSITSAIVQARSEMADVPGIISSIKTCVCICKQVLAALENDEKNPGAVRLLVERYEKIGMDIETQLPHVDQASQVWVHAMEKLTRYFTFAQRELHDIRRVAERSRLHPVSLLRANPTAAKALRLTAALDKIEDSLLSIDGFAAMRLAVVDQNRDFSLLLQGMGSLQTRIDTVLAVERRILQERPVTIYELQEFIAQGIREGMQASYLLHSAPGERDRFDKGFSGRNDAEEEEKAEERVRALDETVESLTKCICESISAAENTNDAVILRMEGIWKPWQISLRNISVETRKTFLGHLPVEIGRGSTGTVYKGTLRINYKKSPDGEDIDVAVKLMDRALANENMKADFIREVGILTELSHPCIVQFMGAYWPRTASVGSDELVEERNMTDPGPMVVTELMTGSVSSLRKERHLLGRSEELKILLDVAEGLQYLHEERIAHMDIKPENVLVRLDNEGRIDGHAKLADFGVSRKKRDTVSLSPSTVALGGTLLYMAPEVMTKNAKAPFECDIWSFGVLMCYLLLPAETAHELFTVTDEQISLAVHDGTWHDRLLNYAGAIDDDALRQMAISCLSVIAAHRPQSRDVRSTLAATSCGCGGLWASRAHGRDTDVIFYIGMSYFWGWIGKKDGSEASRWLRLAEELGSLDARHMLALYFENNVPLEENTVVINLTNAVANSDMRATFFLALNYENGFGVAKDLARAIELYKAAAAAGITYAQKKLGDCYQTGAGVPLDMTMAVKAYRQAADLGDATAQCNLALCYQDGSGIEENDMDKSFKLLKLAACAGEPTAQYLLGVRSQAGIGLYKDIDKSVALYRRAADAGLAAARNSLANCYETGDGVDKDIDRACELFQLAADAGDTNAQNSLGSCFRTGNGVPLDLIKAILWYEKAASYGNADAQNNLGECYQSGIGVSKDVRSAIKLYQKASHGGNVRAKYNLALCFERGKGVDRDLIEAANLYQEAAEAGIREAQTCIGRFYYNGIILTQDMSTAAEYYKQAAEAEDVEAQFLLGTCYEHGNGVEKNIAQAVRYYQLAADRGNNGAQNRLEVLSRRPRRNGRRRHVPLYAMSS